MKKKSLTDAYLRTLEARRKEFLVTDKVRHVTPLGTFSLCMRVFPTGRKLWVARIRTKSLRLTHTLGVFVPGRFDGMTADQAWLALEDFASKLLARQGGASPSVAAAPSATVQLSHDVIPLAQRRSFSPATVQFPVCLPPSNHPIRIANWSIPGHPTSAAWLVSPSSAPGHAPVKTVAPVQPTTHAVSAVSPLEPTASDGVLLTQDPQTRVHTLKDVVDTVNCSPLVKLPESGRNALAKLVHFRAREKFPQMFPDLVATLLHQFGMLLEKIPEMIVSGHSKALDRDLEPAPRVDRLKAMNWQIIEAEPPIHFVLPDCLALGAKTSDFEEMEPYSLLSNDELVGVVMPVCSSKVLVGCIGNPELDVATLNRFFAQCSLDFFISSQDDAQTAEAAQLIGSTVFKYVDSLVEEQAFVAPVRSGNDGKSPETEGWAQEPVRVSITFEPSSRKSGKAQAAVRNLMSAPELQVGLRTVEAIVVADNIVRSLRQRGVALNDYAAQAVRLGTCHMTETPEGVSCQLFVTTASVNLVAKGHPLARAAAALIRHQAGRATYYATVAAKIPKETLQRQRPLLEAVGLRIAHFFCSHYFGGRLSGIGRISDEEFAATDGLYSQTLAGCLQGITNARLHFIENRDVDAALFQALGHVEQLLCATAIACSTTGGEVDRWKASKSIETLQAVSLGDWLELFALDLERFFDSRESLAGDNDLVLLGSHIERVLWSLGIVLSTQAPEQIWMDVLVDEQLENMRLMLRA